MSRGRGSARILRQSVDRSLTTRPRAPPSLPHDTRQRTTATSQTLEPSSSREEFQMNFLLVLALVLTVSWSPSPAQAATVANALCPGEDGQFNRVLGRAPTVAAREDPAFLHAPTIGIAFEHDFNGGRLFVSDSRQGIRGALGPKNSSRILEVNPTTGQVTERITGLPTGDHPTEQLTVMDGWLVWSQGSVTNSGVVGHDNTGPGGVGGRS